MHVKLCKTHNIDGIHSESVLSMICNRLGNSKLLLVESSKSDIHQRMLLNIGMDDLNFALHSDTDIGMMVDETI